MKTDGAAEINVQAKVKICGILEQSTLQGMAGLPVDYIGFVFAKSRRQLTPERAGELYAYSRNVPMANEMPPQTVGVFVNPSLEQLAETIAVVPLDVVQLHGEESPSFCRDVQDQFGVEVWRALPVGDDEEPAGSQRLAAYKDCISTIVLDTAGGGTGKAFRWDVIPSYQEAADAYGLQLFIAGGLDPDNADQLLSAYRPAGVDVSSGVETGGAKDIAKIALFTERVKGS